MIVSSGATEPEWREPWQKQLITWLKTLAEEEVSIAQKEIAYEKLDATEAKRNSHLTNGYAATLVVANAALKLPNESFLWKGIWHDDADSGAAFKPYGIEKGWMWIPSGPTTANLLAWLYSWDRPWNPYHGDANVARRAAIISIIDLIMIRENVHYYTSGEIGCRQPKFPARACESGFSLTFNAYTYLHVRSALPKEVLDAWGEGLRWYTDHNLKSRPGGPENMQLSVPVGIYYAGMALNSPNYKEDADFLMNKLLDSYYSPAGYIRDANVPDGSYNGISLHRLAEYWAISRSERVLEVLKSAYELKQHLVLPEPDGSTLSPSHFNARCKDGFDVDQYGGREVIFLNEVPNAGYFIRDPWRKSATPAEVEQSLKRPFSRLAQPAAWVSNHRWEMVLTLPYVTYHGKDEHKMEEIMEQQVLPVVQKQERYSKNLGDEFFFIRRPKYAAIFYAGPAVVSDNGQTNHGGMLKPDGGYLMGFAGGGLSAFWTPESSSLILGRLTAYEGYQRMTRSFKWGDYVISGWRDWLNNQVVGETLDGKILSTSRTPRPTSSFSNDESELVIAGVAPKKLRKQGDITDVNLAYKRHYRFNDDGIDCALELNVDQPLRMKSLYESLPVMMEQQTRRKEAAGQVRWEFLNAEGEPLQELQRIEGVKTVVLSRYEGSSSLVFEKPVTISTETVAATSTQSTTMKGRALLIELPTDLVPGQSVTLRYKLVPSVVKPRVAMVHPIPSNN